LCTQIQDVANDGVMGKDPLPVLHEVQPNGHSDYLVKEDPRYKFLKANGHYYGGYQPEEN
jgi:hypothetical protein